MKLITRDVDYAVRALAYIAKAKEKNVPVSCLVEELKIPRPFLRKLLQMLRACGVLVSAKGAGGGFLLAKPAADISLLDVITGFQGPFSINECTFKKSVCPNTKNCALRKNILRIQRTVSRELESVSIASLVSSRSG